MGVKEYSDRRLGCSVCPKTATTNNSSSNRLRFEKKHAEKNITTSQKYKCEKSEIIPKVNECYCYQMELIKKESCPKLICSKRFKAPNIEIDKDWLNGILEFRRENWFDCHTDTTFF
ncbi:Hypothetical protein CINCED_3A025786 [Cinara cedri]|uniref:Uncharacterized protein n=1 Tax=Cinara cedri TaxID=506608 RepID=A0A5E4MUR3_9HEMI|nr:Hypothetical protein CINCED_3A025786 [Cinara cedri]